MKVCKECGFYNEDRMNFCGNCGAILEEVKTPADNGKKQSEKRADSVKDSKEPKKRSVDYSAENKTGKYAEPLDEKNHIVGGDLIFIGITLLLLVLTLVTGYIYVNRKYEGDGFSEKFVNMLNPDTSGTKAVITGGETDDGKPAMLITIYSREGNVIIFREGATRLEKTIENDSITLRVPLSLWLDNLGDELLGGIDIEPNIFVYNPTANHEIKRVAVTPYHVEVNPVDIILTNPTTLEITTAETSMMIEGYVTDVRATLFMNGEKLPIDDKGYFKTVYRVENYGAPNVITFAAVSPDMPDQIVGKTVLTVKYDRSNIECVIYNESLRTTENEITINGKIEPNTDLTVSGVELLSEVSLNKSSGEFSFVVSVPTVGNYPITLTLKSEKTGESTMDIFAEHAPDKNTYLNGARTFDDYDYVLEHSTLDKHYSLSGSIVEVYQSSPYVKAKMRTAEGDVIFTYYANDFEIEANDGKSYRMYADVVGIDPETNLLMLYCWFITKS